jgi:ketosteroid isomerase-like protein
MRYAPLGLILLAACNGSTPDAAGARAEVEATIKKWHELYDAGNYDALAEMVDPECSFPVPPEDFLHGKDNVMPRIKKDVEEYVLSRDFQGKRKTFYQDIRINVSGSLAVARYAVNIKDPGGVSSALFTRVFRKDGPRWLLLSEHYTVTPVQKTPNK